MRLRDVAQELSELGARDALFRIAWELKSRVPVNAGAPRERVVSSGKAERNWTDRLPFADSYAVADAMRDRIGRPALAALKQEAEDACRGVIRCFGRWSADFGRPIDWHRDPTT